MSSATEYDVIVAGAGAAGLLAAARSAERGRRTLLLEKNRKPGVKILMSGGTRCNLTHATDARGIIEAFGRPGRFLHSALAALGPSELVELFEAEGVATKTEPTGKIFPASNRALDVLNALLARLRRSGAELALAEPLESVERQGDAFRVGTPTRVLKAARLLITTGGQSYPGCGTTGDAYGMLEAMGHSIVPPRPALVPLVVEHAWVRELSGVTIPDVGLRVIDPAVRDAALAGGKRKRASDGVLDARRGSFLFTHTGLSGPAPMDISRAITGHAAGHTLLLECDFLPAMPAAALEEHLRRQSEQAGKRQVGHIIPEMVPQRLAGALLAELGIAADRKAAELSKADRARLAAALKGTTLRASGTRGFAKAEVTAGGVALDEVDSSTMQSKVAPNLYLAGEVLDLDGPIGGYNFQAAFSTGWLAGSSM